MRKLIFIGGILAWMLGAVSTVFAQDNEKKMDDFDEIIIRKKGEGTNKVTIEIKEGEVSVNGKPIEEFDEEGLIIRKRKIPRIPPIGATPRFRQFYYSPGEPLENLEELQGGMTGSGKKALLGVSTENGKEGAKVVQVMEGSGAEKAGIQRGDIITKVNQDNIETAADLIKSIGSYQPGEEVTVTYIRQGKPQTCVVKLGKNPESTLRSFDLRIPDMPEWRDLGWGPEGNREDHFEWRDVPDGKNWNPGGGKPRLGIKAQDREDAKGVDVLEVAPSSAAEKAGLKKGDIILRFDGKEVNGADELADVAAAAGKKESVSIELSRNAKKQIIEIRPPRKLKTAQL